jgi:hypothetical protein
MFTEARSFATGADACRVSSGGRSEMDRSVRVVNTHQPRRADPAVRSTSVRLDQRQDNVIVTVGRTLFDRRQWVYGLRTNQHFTLKQNPLRRKHLDEFVDCYAPGKPRSERVTSERFKSFTHDELMARDKANLDITWLRDGSLEDLDNLPAPEIIAREIVEDLTAALAEFEAVAAALEQRAGVE